MLPTLVEIRESTLSRCGLATTGNIQRNIKTLLDEKARSAQAQLYHRCPWLINYVKGTITLDADVTDYAVPDDTEAGKIEFIAVRDSSTGEETRLERGIRPGEADHLTTDSMPQRFEFIDQIIRIAPTADTTRYDALCLYYYQVPNDLVNDADRVVVDGEAMKALTEILVKEHFGGVDTSILREDLRKYIEDLKSKQSTGDGFQMGGRRSFRGMNTPRNRFGSGRGDWQDWRPW